MTLAEILCTCGSRFSVQDDGSGVPHQCPQCGMQNVLPRSPSAVENETVVAATGAETAVRSTRVLSRVGQSVVDAVRGLPAGTQLGPYRLVGRIGKGGMGSVYEAMDDRLDRKVALKVLSPELAQKPDFVARFQRESRSLEELSDPRIAKVYFNGAAEGLPFFAMEFIEGRNLEEILEQDGVFEPKLAISLMSEAAIGLSAAAENGTIHRDVKPTNLLVDQDGNLRIVDFGLAKSVDSESRLTVTGAVVGTPYYLSPEQGLGKPVDERSDIYSLGATFYHLLCGETPFEAESPVSIIMCHVNEAPDLLTDRNPDVPEPLARVVMRCMAKDPERRYQDYDELLDDLAAVKAGEPVTAPPQAISVKKARPSVVVMDDLDEGARVLRRASRVRRAVGMLLDVGVLAVGWQLADLLAAKGVAWNPYLIMVPLGFLYVALGDGLGGRSIGKRFASLRVARPDGSNPGWPGALLRASLCLPLLICLGALLEFPPSVLGDGINDLFPALTIGTGLLENLFKVLYGLVIVDLGASFFTRRRETMHDLMSGSSVFREQRVKKRKKVRKKKASRKPKWSNRRGPASKLRPEDLPNPLGPTLASVFVPGLGQLWNDQGSKGLVFFIGLVASMVMAVNDGVEFLPFVIWGLNIYDANRTAHRRIATARAGQSKPSDF